MHLRRSSIPAVIALLLLSIPAFARDFTGKVVGVSDGDTITVMHNGKGEKVRLHGVDAPESSQAFGQKAKQFTSGEVFGKVVSVHVEDTDRYSRTVGVVKCSGRTLNYELLKAGLGWWYKRYAPKDKEAERLEKEAREAKRGLWADPNPTPPWDYRKDAREGKAPESTSSVSVAGDAKVWVNLSSGKYFFEGHRYYGKTKRGEFMLEREAKKRGYVAAKG